MTEDLKTVREALELGNAAINYEAGYRVMDAGLAALSRLEAQQQEQIDYENGRIRGSEGATVSDNPYPTGKRGHVNWERGWLKGILEDSKREVAAWPAWMSGKPAAPPVEPCPRCAELQEQLRELTAGEVSAAEYCCDEVKQMLVAECDRLQATVKALVEGLRRVVADADGFPESEACDHIHEARTLLAKHAQEKA